MDCECLLWITIDQIWLSVTFRLSHDSKVSSTNPILVDLKPFYLIDLIIVTLCDEGNEKKKTFKKLKDKKKTMANARSKKVFGCKISNGNTKLSCLFLKVDEICIFLCDYFDGSERKSLGASVRMWLCDVEKMPSNCNPYHVVCGKIQCKHID